VKVAGPAHALDRLGVDRATYIVAVTHDPRLEEAAPAIALRSASPYVGTVGSRRAQANRAERLRELGRRGKERPLGNRMISTGGRIHGQVERG
jgi:xanthine dehydrogenase accessory factor